MLAAEKSAPCNLWMSFIDSDKLDKSKVSSNHETELPWHNCVAPSHRPNRGDGEIKCLTKLREWHNFPSDSQVINSLPNWTIDREEAVVCYWRRSSVNRCPSPESMAKSWNQLPKKAAAAERGRGSTRRSTWRRPSPLRRPTRPCLSPSLPSDGLSVLLQLAFRHPNLCLDAVSNLNIAAVCVCCFELWPLDALLCSLAVKMEK